jgi:hypothetical protein
VPPDSEAKGEEGGATGEAAAGTSPDEPPRDAADEALAGDAPAAPDAGETDADGPRES